MSKIFERTDHVVIDQPLSPFYGFNATVIRSTGPGVIRFSGLVFNFLESYHVYVHGYGSIDQGTGQDLIFPVEFLEYAEPDTDKPLYPSTWEEFNSVMYELGYPEIVNIIKQGSKT